MTTMLTWRMDKRYFNGASTYTLSVGDKNHVANVSEDRIFEAEGNAPWGLFAEIVRDRKAPKY